MQVYGEFVKLPNDHKQLPVPWPCRIPLGLSSQTSVYVALSFGSPLNSSGGFDDPLPTRPPDIIVTVIDPKLWDQTSVIRVTRPDGHGVLNEVFEQLRRLHEESKLVNIVIGESTTLTGESRLAVPLAMGGVPAGSPSGVGEHRGRVHEICLYCEQLGEKSEERLREWSRDCNARLSGNGWLFSVTPYCPPDQLKNCIVWPSGSMRSGLVELRFSWREVLEKRLELMKLSSLTETYDFGNAAVTADLVSRAVRFVFPKKGAKRVLSDHADIPNVWSEITRVIADRRFSILSEYLRKTGLESGKLEAICEPIDPTATLDDSCFDTLLKNKPSDLVSVRVRNAKPFEECTFAPVSHDEICRKVASNPQRQRQLLSRLAREWVGSIIGSIKGSRRGDLEDCTLAGELWKAAAETLNVSQDVPNVRLVSELLRQHNILYFSTGAPPNFEDFQPEDKAVRVLLDQAVEDSRKKGTERFPWLLIDGDTLSGGDASEKLSYLSCATAAMFVIVRPFKFGGNRQSSLRVMSSAAQCVTNNLGCTTRLLIDESEMPASWGQNPDLGDHLGQVGKFLWNINMSKVVANRTDPQGVWKTPGGLPALVGAWLDQISSLRT